MEKNRENIFCHKLNKGMETVREFIEEAVEEYNSGRLTPIKLQDMKKRYDVTFDIEHFNKLENPRNAHYMLENLFAKQKGRTVLERVGFKWSEVEKCPNPYYDD